LKIYLDCKEGRKKRKEKKRKEKKRKGRRRRYYEVFGLLT
jgi:hypothetical protein